MHTKIESTVMNCHIPVTQLQQLTHSLSCFVCISPHVLPFLCYYEADPSHQITSSVNICVSLEIKAFKNIITIPSTTVNKH